MTSEHSIFETKSSAFNKTIEVPSSKSYANRLLILAALSPKPTKVKNLPLSSDVEYMIKCLNLVGLDCVKEGNDVTVTNQFPNCESEGEETIVLETGDGGTTNRFLLPFLALGKRKYELKACGHMRVRPMEALVEALKFCQATLTYNPVLDEYKNWITVQGPVKGESVNIDCSETTQFLTGLTLAFSKTGIKVVPKNLTVSLPYWHLTQALIKEAAKEPDEFINPVDFSSLSYPLALAAVMGEVKVTNCHNIDENQADSKFIKVLRDMGVEVSFGEDGLHCMRKELKPVTFDGSQCPDVIPTLIFVCSFTEGESHLTNLEVLTHKECDRYEEMIRLMEAAGISYEASRSEYSLKIIGSKSIKPFDFDPVADHRMVMVTYLFQRMARGGVILKNTHHVKKSFANFFEVMS